MEPTGIGKTYRKKLIQVLEKSPAFITPTIASRTLNISAQEAGRVLSRWNKSGWVTKVKRGVYSPLSLDLTPAYTSQEDAYLLAETLYAPGYIGGFGAVKHWDMSEQIFETIYYFTSRKISNKNPRYGQFRFRLKTVRPYKIFGLKTLWSGSKKVSISDPSKTIIDLLDDPKIVGGITIVTDIFSNYFESDYFDFDLLFAYAKKTQNRTIFKRLGFLLESRFNYDDKLLNPLQMQLSKGYSELDPGSQSNHTIEKWRLKTTRSWKNSYDQKK